MPVPKQKFREVVFQMLYSYDTGHANDENMVELLSTELAVTKKVVREAQEKVRLILACQEELDEMITHASHSYAFERIQSVERNILRLEVFELFFDDSVPPKVAMTEGMRLAKKFSTKEAASFINAILDTLYKASLGEKVDIKNIEKSAEALSQLEKISNKAAKESKKETS